MPGPRMPRVRPFRIAAFGYRFVDMRELNDRQQGRAENAWVRYLIEEYESQMDSRREKMGLCNWDLGMQERLLKRFERIKARRPNLTWDDFEQAGGTYEYDHHGDPRLRQLDLAIVTDDNRIVGKMPIRNIEVERDADGNLTASFQGTPGVAIPDGFTRAQTWARIYYHLLENDLTFRNGRVLDLVEVRFPVDLPGYRFRPRPWNDLGDMLRILRRRAVVEELATEEVDTPKRFRRQSAPEKIVVVREKTDLDREVEAEVDADKQGA